MKTILLALLLSMCASGCEDSLCKEGWINTAGLTVCTNGFAVDSDELEYAVNELELHVNALYPEVGDLETMFANNGTTVYFMQKIFAVDCFTSPHTTNLQVCEKSTPGVTIGGNVVYIYYYSDCLPSLSIIHELLHVVERHSVIPNQSGDTHDPLNFFAAGQYNTLPSIETTVNNSIREILYRCSF